MPSDAGSSKDAVPVLGSSVRQAVYVVDRQGPTLHDHNGTSVTERLVLLAV